MHCPWVLFGEIMVLVLPSPAKSSWQVLVSAGEYSSVLPEVHSGGGKTKQFNRYRLAILVVPLPVVVPILQTAWHVD